jgi:hypothetical protein
MTHPPSRVEDLSRASDERRLMDEGLDRHAALHAVGSVLIDHLASLAVEATIEDPNAAYVAAPERLPAEEWERSGMG